MPPGESREISPQSRDRIREIAASFHLDLTEHELETIDAVSDATIDTFQRIEQLADPKPDVGTRGETWGRVPATVEPLNAWVTACDVSGTDDGPVAGDEVGL